MGCSIWIMLQYLWPCLSCSCYGTSSWLFHQSFRSCIIFQAGSWRAVPNVEACVSWDITPVLIACFLKGSSQVELYSFHLSGTPDVSFSRVQWTSFSFTSFLFTSLFAAAPTSGTLNSGSNLLLSIYQALFHTNTLKGTMAIISELPCRND